MASSQSLAIRELARQHQVVTVIGARGTGKSMIARELVENWQATGVKTVAISAPASERASDLIDPLAAALECDPDDLTAEHLPEGAVVRLVVDQCERLHGRSWLPGLQERWRALLSTTAARGRVGVVLLGRPLFRQIAGGRGSPLLNLGPVVTTQPLAEEDIARRFAVADTTARAVRRKTGGHPQLTAFLVEAIGGGIEQLGAAMDGFVRTHERYLLRLVEDHTLAGASLLRDLLEAGQPIPEAAVIRRHFGSSYSEGHEVLQDLAASGLAVEEGGQWRPGAELLGSTPVAFVFLPSPDVDIPTNEPAAHSDAAALTYFVENRLRELVVSELAGADSSWWPTRIPRELVGEAESRRKSELESPVSSSESSHPIMYLSLGELFEVMHYGENWPQVFRLATRLSRTTAEGASRSLMAVRNKVAHNRPVAPEDLEGMRAAARTLNLLRS